MPVRRAIIVAAVGAVVAITLAIVFVPPRGEAAAMPAASIGTAVWATAKPTNGASTSRPTVTPTARPTSSSSPTRTPTSTPSSTASGTPSSTPSGTASSTPTGSSSPSGASTSGNPFGSRPFYVDPHTWAAWAEEQYPNDAGHIRRIARTPQARWIGDWTPTAQVASYVDEYVSGAQAAHASAVLTLYAIPHRDCGGFSAGGLAGPDAYSAWIDQVIKGIAGRPVAVIAEPDALTSADCLDADARAQRMSMLKDAIERLSADPDTAVYIDAGHSRWLGADTLAGRLRAVGVDRVRGFSLNVSNFYTTAEEIAFGERVSALLGGAHYVIDTSRNGAGPAPDAPLNWCNPSGRALGVAPTTTTAGAHADAYLWIKHPGESDGTCDRDDPVSGSWFNDYAVGMVARSSS